MLSCACRLEAGILFEKKNRSRSPRLLSTSSNGSGSAAGENLGYVLAQYYHTSVEEFWALERMDQGLKPLSGI